MATDMEKYVKIGDVIEVAIDTVAFGGNGVGRIHDLVVFVPFTVEGDRVEVEISGQKKVRRRKNPQIIHSFSSQRTTPLPLFHPLRRLSVSAHPL
jgi:23S rRNA (uracil1939-C5)-methyltransferase